MKNIIIIDMQKGFINENNKFLIDRINKYISNNHFDNLFLTKCVNNNNSPYKTILNWNGMTTDDEQLFAIPVPKDAKIITKNGYGISAKDIEHLKKLGVEEIEICGTETDACCLAVAFNLFDNNIKPIILADLCASSEDACIHNNTLEIMQKQFGNENVRYT